MGTNYYLHEKPPCDHCKREYPALHIGKYSAGWCFSLHVIPEENINDLDAWKARWSAPESHIVDEYGRTLTPDEMLDKIANRSRERKGIPYGYGSKADFHASNRSCDGPNGLFRSKVDGQHCVKHGEGTWDCITGEFS